MLEPLTDPIIQRLHKLNAAINSSGIDCKENVSSRHFLAKEGLLDALLVLYDECNNDLLKKNSYIAKFVDKYRSTIHKLRNLRVNLNDFEQKKIIGKGHFGVVQVVREKQTGNVYALKILQKAETLAQQHVTFYEEERDIMAKASSPWITHLQYAFQDEHNLYLMMDFHPGGDLLSLLDRFNYIFTEEMMKFYLAEITVAIHAVHSMGYVHRDVKPDNILIDRCGHIKLADFGSAAKLTSSKIVHSEMPVGTPDYVAPEILTSMNKKHNWEATYGVECDFWSLGIMAYEMLYGETPFKGNNAVATYSNIMNHEKKLKFPDTDENDVSEAAKNLIKGLLSNDQQRLCYNRLIKHKYFLHTNWNNLESVQPPFIPVVTSVDDTSNFEEFEYKQSAPNIEAFRTKAVFSGFQLPFIGFTYNRPTSNDTKDEFSQSFIASSLNSTLLEPKDPSQLELELKAKKKELHAAQLKIQSLSESQQRKTMISDMEKRAIEAERKVTMMENQLKSLRKETLFSNQKIQKLKENLASEKAERLRTEAKTLEFLRGIKQKWKKEEEEKTKHFTEKVELYRKTAEAVNERLEEALRQLREMTLETVKAEEEAVKYKQLLKEKENEFSKLSCEMKEKKTDRMDEEVRKKLDETLKELDEEKRSRKNLSGEVEELNRINSELNGINTDHETQSEENEATRKTLQNEVHGLREEIKRCKSDNESLCSQLIDMEEKSSKEKGTLLQELELKLSHQQQECYQLKIKLQELSQSLNESMATRDSFVNEQECLGSKLKDTEEELQAVSREKGELVLELSVVSSREDEQRLKIQDLESVLDSLKQSLNRLETQQLENVERSNQQKTEAQLELLEKQLKSSQDSAASDKEKFHVTEDNLRKLGKETSDLKLDLRSCQRELKQSQETAQFLRERSREMKDQLKEKEDEIKKWALKENEFEEKLRKKEGEIFLLQKNQEKTKEENQRLKGRMEEQKEEIEGGKTKMEELQRKIVTFQTEVDKAKIERRRLEGDLRMGERERERNGEETLYLKDAIKDLEKKSADLNNVIENLKTVCSEQDDQLSAVDKFEEKLETFACEKQTLNNEINKLQSELKMCRVSSNEEKSLRLFQERRVKDLENKISAVDQEYDQQKMNLQDEIHKLKEENRDLQTQISEMENEFSEAASKERSLEHDRLELQTQMELIKEEVSGHIQHIHSLKDSNFKLTDGLEEAISKGELYKQRIEELERDSRQERAVFEDKELKLKSTVGQQTKLIDFLQVKVENPPTKKATLSRMFGGSKNKENSGYMVGHQYRKLEDMLAREKAHTKQLSAQLSKAHAEVVQLKAQATGSAEAQKQKKVLDDISNSPQLHENHPKERMRHKIPHRWQSYLVMRAGRCTGCLGSIPFSQNAVKCQECSLLAHTKCSKNIANTCGLPVAFAHHYTQSQASSSADQSSCHERESAMKGWIKVPRSGKANWEKRFAVLTNNELRLYDQEPVSSLKPVKTVNLDNKNSKIVVLHSVAMSELPDTNASDFPYILKIDPREIGSSEEVTRPVYLMTSSFEEKQSWISALEEVVQQRGVEARGTDNDLSRGTVEMETIIALNSVTPLDVNTVVFLNDKTAVVGAVEGLFSFSKDESGQLKFRARIEGISSVYEIVLVKAVGVAVFIGGKDNYIYHTNLELLNVAAEASQMAKPSIDSVSVDPKISCHLISASRHAKRVFMCAAASNRISIFVWSNENQTFEVCRQYSTQEPCSCFQFTPSSLIVGAERFYKINLKNFSIEEYLDESDTSLAYAIYGSAQMSSFPVAIIQVSGSGKHEEYLLVFYEFGIFVDAQGRRSREFDLKFVRLPIEIVFCPPYLYILHHNSVEVLEIRAESFTKIRGMSFDSDTECAPVVRSACKMLNKPRFLGNCLDLSAVVLATSSEDHVEIISLKASFPVDPDLSLTWSMNTSIQNQQNMADTSETTSLCSEVSTLSSCSDSANSSLKRTKFPNFMRASKRTKKHGK